MKRKLERTKGKAKKWMKIRKEKRRGKENAVRRRSERKLEDVLKEMRPLTKRKVKKSPCQRNEKYYEGGKTPPLLTAETIEKIWLDNRAVKKYIITKYIRNILFLTIIFLLRVLKL